MPISPGWPDLGGLFNYTFVARIVFVFPMQKHNIWYIQTVFPLQTHHIVCTIIHMTTNPHPTRTRSQVEDITKILNLAADSVRKTKLAGFGKIILTVNIRHGAICESIIEESNTQTVKL